MPHLYLKHACINTWHKNTLSNKLSEQSPTVLVYVRAGLYNVYAAWMSKKKTDTADTCDTAAAAADRSTDDSAVSVRRSTSSV